MAVFFLYVIFSIIYRLILITIVFRIVNMSFSVILPTLNENDHILKLISEIANI